MIRVEVLIIISIDNKIMLFFAERIVSIVRPHISCITPVIHHHPPISHSAQLPRIQTHPSTYTLSPSIRLIIHSIFSNQSSNLPPPTALFPTTPSLHLPHHIIYPPNSIPLPTLWTLPKPPPHTYRFFHLRYIFPQPLPAPLLPSQIPAAPYYPAMYVPPSLASHCIPRPRIHVSAFLFIHIHLVCDI